MIRLHSGHQDVGFFPAHGEGMRTTVGILADLYGGPLLPNARRIRANIAHLPGALSCIAMTRIQSLDMPQLLGQDYRAAFLDTLKSCHQLQFIHLEFVLARVDQLQHFASVSSVLSSRPSLRECTLRVKLVIPLERHVVSHLASWPRLGRLAVQSSAHVKPPPGFSGAEPDQLPTKYVFDHLESLCEAMTSASSILRWSDTPVLKEYALCSSASTMELLLPLLSSISPRTLQKLVIDHHQMGDSMPAAPIPFSALEPVLAFCNLSMLRINIFGPSILVDDTEWEQCAQSWPQLRTLHLPAVRSRAANSKVKATYKSLIAIARLCPHIMGIAIVISDTRRPADWEVERETLPVAPQMKYLDLLTSDFKDLEFTAEWIYKMFPNVWPRPVTPRAARSTPQVMLMQCVQRLRNTSLRTKAL